MQNIYDILGNIGITVPEDKKADFDKSVNDYLFKWENHKPMSSYLGTGCLNNTADDNSIRTIFDYQYFRLLPPINSRTRES